MSTETAFDVIAAVQDYYGTVLSKTEDLRTSACTACKPPPPHVRAALKRIPKEVTEKFYGCGNPFPCGIRSVDVLDLGSGSGRDCYAAALLVGPKGSVTGVDMTAEQLDVARAHVDHFRASNPEAASLRFLQGFIEDVAGAGVAANSMDLIISNCVINLSPNKLAVLESAYRALRVGGEMHFSDVYVDRRLPDAVRQHRVLYGECLAGALYEGDFLSMARRVGFTDPRELERAPISVTDPELHAVVGNAKFFSITYRLFKLPGLDDRCEDYGQIAWYNGTIDGLASGYQLDDHHYFETGRPVLVCGNTADMIQHTWLAEHFRVDGSKAVHYGVFDCKGSRVAPQTEKSSCGTNCC